MECSVCIEKITPKNNGVVCPNRCEFVCCYKCFETQANVKQEINVSCMKCKYIYNFQDIDYMGTFKKKNTRRVADLIISQQQHLLPLLEVKAEKNRQAIIINDRLRLHRQKLRQLNADCRDTRYDIALATENRNALLNYDITSSVYKMGCLIPKCNGYINEYDMCSKCKVAVCSICYTVKQDLDHICKEDEIATAKYMTENSVPCPTCKIRISRVDGCDDMFCVNCRTKFSYKSGTKIMRKIHNPHILENAQLLNDCMPIDPPYYSMYLHKWDDPKYSLTNDIRQITQQASNGLDIIDRYTSEKVSRFRLNQVFADNIARNLSANQLRKSITEIVQRTEYYNNARPLFDELRIAYIDIEWKFVENQHDMTPLIFRSILLNSYLVVKWFNEELKKLNHYTKRQYGVEEISTSQLLFKINRIKPEDVCGSLFGE